MMSFLDHLEGFVTSKFSVTKGLFTLFKLEAKLAGLNIGPLLISLGALIALVLSAWLTVMILIGYLMMLLVDPLIAIIIVLLLNVGALFLVIKSLLSCLRQMSFEKTRALLLSNQKDSHELTKRTTKFH